MDVERFDGYAASPEAALGAIAAHEGPIVVDFDETLFLHSSTEEFIDLAWPGFAALIVLRVLDLLQPWRFGGGDAMRDVWRVLSIRILFPWTIFRWRRHVLNHVEELTNKPLLDALKLRADMPIIATLGFRSIVGAVIAAMGLGAATLVAVSTYGFADRRRGKLAMLCDEIGEHRLRQSLVLTDSHDDMPLLSVCAKPLHTVWPQAQYRTALAGTYFPGRYLHAVKRPESRYIVRGILQEDFAFWVLASIGLSTTPLWHLIALSLLAVSFWAVYELGYVDNDRVAERYEASPMLSAAYHDHLIATPTWTPWVWSVLAAALGVAILKQSLQLWSQALGLWMAGLLLMYCWYRVYNRCDKGTRIWMFAGLQLARATAILLVVPALEIGGVALAALALSRWVGYFFYRLSGGAWPEKGSQTMRLLFFVCMAMCLALASGPGVLMNWSGAALLAWCIFRARRELVGIVADASLIDRGEFESDSRRETRR